MQSQNTTENIFRFVHVRGAAPADTNEGLRLSGDTRLAGQMQHALPDERQRLASGFLEGLSATVFDSEVASALLSGTRAVIDRDGTAAELQETHTIPEDVLQSLRRDASDVLLAGKFAGRASEHAAKADLIFRASGVLLGPTPDPSEKLRVHFRRTLRLPPNFSPAIAPRQAGDARRFTQAVSQKGTVEDVDVDAGAVLRAYQEVVALARPEMLNVKDADDEEEATPPPNAFSLNERGLRRLSDDSRRVLAAFNLDAASTPIDRLVSSLQSEVSVLAGRGRPGPLPGPPPVPEEPLPYIRDVGVADLLVVKQHLKAYERMDIAHVENILNVEKKSRNHRALERTEDTLTTERESITERETELETADRFELNREASRTVKRDQEFGFGLTISGKYGPSVDFSSNIQANIGSSSEETVRNATRYAKDVVERSLERVIERVREEHVRRVIREQEETNLHELENASGQHISGVYQFLEKVYESQIFNYGIRQMFDFMVPEPASYLWHLEKNETALNLPTPPAKLETLVPDFRAIDELNYPSLAATYGASGIDTPPPVFLSASASIINGQVADDDTEEGQPRSVVEKDVAVPDGYTPFRAYVRIVALTDEALAMSMTVGTRRRRWRPFGTDIVDIGSDHKMASGDFTLAAIGEGEYDGQSKLPIHILAFETATYSVVVEVVFQRTDRAYRAWQIKTYDKLAAAYRESMERYNAEVEELKAKAEAESARTTIRFGAPPSQNLKTIKNELKKHCTSIVTRQRYETFNVVHDANPPWFDFVEAEERGSFTRFFEQAFEWDQMQYVFYPYYWGRQSTWAERFLRQDVDPALLEFLQAGAARVVVPVRPGFEIAITHYLETLHIWNGQEEVPTINDPLYVPIITEIQERTGASQGEIAVGEPWPTRVPTPLVILRSEDTLPKWERVDPDEWEWQEV